MDEANEVTQLFGDIYLHLHPRREPSSYRPSRASLAVLRHLAIAGPVTVGEAARHLRRSQAATSELLNRLIERQFLARQVDENDRRQHRIWLTPAGQRLVTDESEPLDREELRVVFAGLEDEDRQLILAGLRCLARASEEYAQTQRRNDNERREEL